MTYESRVRTGRTVSVEAKRNLVERSRPRPRVPRATEGAVEYTIHFTPRNGENGDRGGRHLFKEALGDVEAVECCAFADLVA